MILYVMRHGQAEPQAESDRLRALTPEGVREVRRIASAFQELDGGVSAVYCSPYDRTRQTAEILCQALPGAHAQPQAAKALASGADAGKALRWVLQEIQTDALLVSHVPLVGELTSLLVAGDMQTPFSFQPATIVALDMDVPGPGTAELLWTHHPGDW